MLPKASLSTCKCPIPGCQAFIGTKKTSGTKRIHCRECDWTYLFQDTNPPKPIHKGKLDWIDIQKNESK